MSAMGEKQRGRLKTARIPVKVVPAAPLPKPEWIRVRLGNGERFQEIKRILRDHRLHTVCEEAACPNIGECFGKGTATFMILGDLCTRRCPFCDVAHGKPLPPDAALWRVPNLIITPHISCDEGERYVDISLDLWFDNLARYVEGKPLARRVDRRAGY